MQYIKPYLTLCRVWISLFAACSAATGFFLVPGRHASGVPIPVAAVFLLACGASALNQYQERDIDAKMKRTQGRPLPSGAVTPSRAIIVSAALMFAGLSFAFLAGPVAFALALLALVWYNGVYTYLKRVTAFAAIPGAAVGMIPPAIGWASYGAAFDGKIAATCFIFFLWQVPHFWLLILNHGEDYERAGLPSLTGIMSKTQIARITYVWITAAAVASLALPLYGPLRTPAIYFLLLSLAFWLIWSGKALTERHSLPSLSSALFRKINIYLFIMMSLLTAEGIFF
jgi:protoheme IX farnesyltransferase